MQIGPYKLKTLVTGKFGLDGGAMFGVVPKTIWEKTNPADELNRIDMSLRILYIEGQNQKILVDTGIGTKWAEKYIAMYRIDHSQFTLQKALTSIPVKSEEITDVILTHLHFDHTGGSTYKDANGSIKLTFPNAKHYVQKSQWEHALKPTLKDRASFLAPDFLPIEEAGKLVILDGEKEIYPGIKILVTPGHTPGHQAVKVSSEGKTVLYCGDLIPTSSHIPLPFVMGYDLEPVRTMNEKQKLFEHAVKEGWVLVFEHDPIYAAAIVECVDGRYQAKEKFNF